MHGTPVLFMERARPSYRAEGREYSKERGTGAIDCTGRRTSRRKGESDWRAVTGDVDMSSPFPVVALKLRVLHQSSWTSVLIVERQRSRLY